MEAQGRRYHAVPVALALVLSVALLFGAGRARADGQVDPSFGSGGVFELGLGPGAAAEGATTILPLGQGRFLAVGPGEGNGSWITAHQANGSLDPAFGTGGEFHLHRLRYSFASAAVREADGAIVLAGAENSSSSDYDTMIARVTPQGALDPSFGNDPPNPKGDGVSVYNLGGDDIAEGVALDSAGRVLTAGRVGPGGAYDVKVVRYQADGSIDPAFGGPKGVSTDLGGSDQGIAIGSQGERVIVAASSGTATDLLAYRPDGSLDPSFGGGDGIAPLGIPSEGEAAGLLVEPDGSILLADGTKNRLSIERVLPDGTPDAGFGSAGIVTVPDPIAAKGIYTESLARGDDGKLYSAASTFGNELGAGFVLRLLPNGQPDPSWGANGMLMLPQASGQQKSAWAVWVEPDRRVVVGGEDYFGEPAQINRLVMRLLGDTTPPDTAITHAPKRKLRASPKKQAFRFEAVGDVNTTFECELIRPKPKHGTKKHRRHPKRAAPRFAPCASGVKYRGLRKVGAYRFAVRSIDPAGNVDPTPATARFKVLPKKHRGHHGK